MEGGKLNLILPAKPLENAQNESFIGRLRDQCLNANWFSNALPLCCFMSLNDKRPKRLVMASEDTAPRRPAGHTLS
jgi:hypothetical protein